MLRSVGHASSLASSWQRAAAQTGARSLWSAASSRHGTVATAAFTPPPTTVKLASTVRLARTQTARDYATSSQQATSEPNEVEHAVISTFDLFSVGIGPSSSHTVGPMRAGVIFVSDLYDLGLLERVHTIKIALYGSLALTGKGHLTPEALLGGLEGDDCETVDPASVPLRFEEIKQSKRLFLGRNLGRTLSKSASPGTPMKHVAGKQIAFDYDRDMKWNFGQVLPHHSNGLRLSVFDEAGDMLATNDYYSIGGGFVVNGALATPASSGQKQRAAATHGARDEDGTSLEALKKDTEEVSARPIDFGENIYYKQLRRSDAEDIRRSGSSPQDGLLPQVEAPSSSPEERVDGAHLSVLATPAAGRADGVENLADSTPSGPRFPFHNAASLLRHCRMRNLTIAQIVYENELTWHPPEVVTQKLFKIWTVMDECIRAGVESTEKTLPGPLAVRRRAPSLYARLMRGVYRGNSLLGSPARGGASALPGSEASNDETTSAGELALNPSLAALATQGPRRIIGSMSHPVMPCPPRRSDFAALDYLSCYAIATNEQNAAGGRMVTAPTNGAAGVLPSVLKYCFEFIFDDDPGRDVQNFLLTASAIGMLFKRGATLSAAEGGCMAEVGVATAMAAAGFTAVLGGSPEKILQATGIGIEHNLGLSCDPVGGQVQIPCIERNALGAVKAVTAAQLALAGDGKHSVSLDDTITAMRETAREMHTNYKETSLGGLATAVRIPVTVPDC